MSESGIKRFWKEIFGKEKEVELKTPAEPSSSGENPGAGEECRKKGIQYAKDPKRNGMILTKCTDYDCRKVELPNYVEGLSLTEMGQAAFFFVKRFRRVPVNLRKMRSIFFKEQPHIQVSVMDKLRFVLRGCAKDGTTLYR